MLQIRQGGVWREIASCRIRYSGAWRSLVRIVVFSGGAWRVVASFPGSSISITLSTTTLSPKGHSPLASASVTATPSGGVAPYTYTWSIASEAIPGANTINSPALATTTVTETAPDGTASCVIQCDVTDSLGATATSDPVTISFTIK